MAIPTLPDYIIVSYVSTDDDEAYQSKVQATYSMNMLADTFNKPTSTNTFCIRLDQSWKGYEVHVSLQI